MNHTLLLFALAAVLACPTVEVNETTQAILTEGDVASLEAQVSVEVEDLREVLNYKVSEEMRPTQGRSSYLVSHPGQRQ